MNHTLTRSFLLRSRSLVCLYTRSLSIACALYLSSRFCCTVGRVLLKTQWNKTRGKTYSGNCWRSDKIVATPCHHKTKIPTIPADTAKDTIYIKLYRVYIVCIFRISGLTACIARVVGDFSDFWSKICWKCWKNHASFAFCSCFYLIRGRHIWVLKKI